MGKRRRQLLKLLPSSLHPLAEASFSYLGSSLGLRIEALGVRPFPFGTCTVLTPPNSSSSSSDQSGSEMEVDVVGSPSSGTMGGGSGGLSGGAGLLSGLGGGGLGASPSMAPVVLTVGGIRVQSGYMKDKQMAARPVLHMSASVDLRAATVYEAKALMERVQQLMTNPSLMDRCV
jgi:hypothetical protein